MVQIFAILAAAAITACSTPYGRYKSAKSEYIACVKERSAPDLCETERIIYEVEAREQDRAAAMAGAASDRRQVDVSR